MRPKTYHNERRLLGSVRYAHRPWGIIAGIAILAGVVIAELWHIFKKQADEISDGN